MILLRLRCAIIPTCTVSCSLELGFFANTSVYIVHISVFIYAYNVYRVTYRARTKSTSALDRARALSRMITYVYRRRRWFYCYNNNNVIIAIVGRHERVRARVRIVIIFRGRAHLFRPPVIIMMCRR
jgi:hypothetical protein